MRPETIANHLLTVREKFLKPGLVHEADFHYFRDLGPGDVFLDVGANIGSSVNSLMSVGAAPQLHTFEPNPYLWPTLLEVLSRYQGASSLHMFGLSNCTGILPLHVPFVDGGPILGEASVELEHFDNPVVRSRLGSYSSPGKITFQSVQCKLCRLDDLDLFATHIKIDVEGHEAAVLSGMQKTITKRWPKLLIERGWDDRVMSFMARLGYQAKRYNPRTAALEALNNAKPLNVFFTR